MIGHIYRIIHVESDTQYIGSTFNEPRKRWQQHKGDFGKWMKGKHSKLTIYPYFKKFGIDKFKLILIKDYDVVDRTHLQAYEALWISKLNCVNKLVPFYIKKLSDKKYRKENHNKIHAKNNCLCSGKYTTNNKSVHMKSAKHTKWQSAQ